MLVLLMLLLMLLLLLLLLLILMMPFALLHHPTCYCVLCYCVLCYYYCSSLPGGHAAALCVCTHYTPYTLLHTAPYQEEGQHDGGGLLPVERQRQQRQEG
jgi:hypothetical protein